MPTPEHRPSFSERNHSLRHGLLVLTIALVASAFASTATASDLIDRNANGVTLSVNTKGEALISYTAAGKRRHVLAWGALNAIAPTRARRASFVPLDYAGGWGKYKRDYWKTFRNACTAYTGPALAWKVTACKAPDGSYWALQAWQRMLPNYGLAPSGLQGAWELRLSHWTGELPALEIDTDWAWHQWDHLFGTFRYADDPVYGFRSTASGVPLDTFGRNVYVDTFDSAYGAGWKRENSFLTHTRHRRLLLLVQPARRPSSRQGDALPRDRRRPRCHARRDVAGDLGRGVRQGARPREERADHAARRSSVPRELSCCSRLARVAEVGAEQRALFRRWPAGVSVVVADVDGRRVRPDGLVAGLAVARAAARRDLDRARSVAARAAPRRRRVGCLDALWRAGASRAALRAQRAADRALERHRGARGRSAVAGRRGRLADRPNRRRDPRPATTRSSSASCRPSRRRSEPTSLVYVHRGYSKV